MRCNLCGMFDASFVFWVVDKYGVFINVSPQNTPYERVRKMLETRYDDVFDI